MRPNIYILRISAAPRKKDKIFKKTLYKDKILIYNISEKTCLQGFYAEHPIFGLPQGSSESQSCTKKSLIC